MLVSLGSMEQYKACGLLTVKDQMKLRKLIGNQCQSPSGSQSGASQTSSNSNSQCIPEQKRRKIFYHGGGHQTEFSLKIITQHTCARHFISGRLCDYINQASPIKNSYFNSLP